MNIPATSITRASRANIYWARFSDAVSTGKENIPSPMNSCSRYNINIWSLLATSTDKRDITATKRTISDSKSYISRCGGSESKRVYQRETATGECASSVRVGKWLSQSNCIREMCHKVWYIQGIWHCQMVIYHFGPPCNGSPCSVHQLDQNLHFHCSILRVSKW